MPLFRLLRPKAKVLFYGHFPDRLLAQQGTGAMKKVKQFYRRPFDALESWSTGCADSVIANSKFTRSVFKQTFSSMRSRDLKVIYPCVDTSEKTAATDATLLWPEKEVFLSINRFEGKKNLGLAIQAFAGLSPEERSKARLVIAGGYDDRIAENANTLAHLQRTADELKLTHATYRGTDTASLSTDSEHPVLFLLSVPTDLKTRLLASTSILIYTPRNEHFGIVPLEAMLARVPVLATNTGGPLETIYDGRTGWLRSPEPGKIAQWTDVLRKPLIPSSADSLKVMGERGRERVVRDFGHEKMSQELDKEVQRLCGGAEGERPRLLSERAVMVIWALLGLVGMIVGFVVARIW